MKILGVSPLRQKLSWYLFGIRLLRDEKYSLRCARCGAKMQKVQRKNSIIDMCPHCGGIFLDYGEINKLAKLSNKKENKAKTKKQKSEVNKSVKQK